MNNESRPGTAPPFLDRPLDVDAGSTLLRNARTRAPSERRACARRRGYVLVLTLLLLALAATAMAGICRSSLGRWLEAQSAAEELQRRWAVLSVRSAVLPRAGKLLAAAESTAGTPLRSITRRLEFGGQRFELVLADEQAKIDANALVYFRGRIEAQATLNRVLGARGVRLPAKLLAGADNRKSTFRSGPASADHDGGAGAEGSGDADGGPDASDRPRQRGLFVSGAPKSAGVANDVNPSLFDADRPLQSLGQVFPGVDAARLTGSRGAPGPAAEVTCWGDGRLNLTRAAPEAVEQAVSPVLAAAQARRLVNLRDEFPEADLGELATRMQLPSDVQDRLEERLCDDSACHSLWIIASARGRAWYDLAVMDTSGGEGAATGVTFNW